MQIFAFHRLGSTQGFSISRQNSTFCEKKVKGTLNWYVLWSPYFGMLSCGASLLYQILLYPYPHHQPQEVLWLTSFFSWLCTILYFMLVEVIFFTKYHTSQGIWGVVIISSMSLVLSFPCIKLEGDGWIDVGLCSWHCSANEVLMDWHMKRHQQSSVRLRWHFSPFENQD